MFINDYKWKVNRVNEEATAHRAEDAADDAAVRQYIQDTFSPAEETDSATQNANPIYDYMFGMVDKLKATDVDEALAAGETPPGYLPEIKQYLIDNPNAINHLDVMEDIYTKEKKAVEAKIAEKDALLSHEPPPANSAAVEAELNELEKKLKYLTDQLEELKAYKTQQEELSRRELREWKDLDLNNIIGQYGMPGSAYVVYKENGEESYYDIKTGKSVSVFHSDRPAKVLSGGEINTEELVMEGGETIDLRVNLTDSSGATINYPQSLWVEREGGDAAPSAYKLDDEDPDSKMVVYNKWTTEDGTIKQVNPTDLSKYIQVRVGGVKLYTDNEGRNIIEYYNGSIVGGTIIARVVLEGRNVPLTIDGGGELGVVDASQYRPTFHKPVRDALSGVPRPSNSRGRAIYDAYENYFGNGATETNISYDDDEKAVTGVRIKNFTGGDITGSEGDDIIEMLDPNNDQFETEEERAKDKEKITKNHAFYSTRIRGGGGVNVVKVAGGDHYIEDAAFVYAKTNNSRDENAVAFTYENDMPKIPGSEERLRNFGRFDGGTAYVYNPPVASAAELNRAENPEAAANTPKNYFEGTTVHYFDKEDACIVGQKSDGGYSEADLAKLAEARMTKFYEAWDSEDGEDLIDPDVKKKIEQDIENIKKAYSSGSDMVKSELEADAGFLDEVRENGFVDSTGGNDGENQI